MKRVQNSFLILLALALVAWSFYMVLQEEAPAKYQGLGLTEQERMVVRVGEHLVPVEVVESNEERAQGLSGRESLAVGTGMLFVFEEPQILNFWMKDMKFPIDIVWIDENWVVIGVEREVSPETFPKLFSPTRPAQYVLELNTGAATELGIDTGVLVYLGAQN